MSTENLEGPAMPGGPSISMADLDHDDKGPRLIACAAVTWTIALVSLVLRFYTRIKLVNRFGLSDWFILLSLVAATEYLASLIARQCSSIRCWTWRQLADEEDIRGPLWHRKTRLGYQPERLHAHDGGMLSPSLSHPVPL